MLHNCLISRLYSLLPHKLTERPTAAHTQPERDHTGEGPTALASRYILFEARG